jgi:hypothetical protein
VVRISLSRFAPPKPLILKVPATPLIWISWPSTKPSSSHGLPSLRVSVPAA